MVARGKWSLTGYQEWGNSWQTALAGFLAKTGLSLPRTGSRARPIQKEHSRSALVKFNQREKLCQEQRIFQDLRGHGKGVEVKVRDSDWLQGVATWISRNQLPGLPVRNKGSAWNRQVPEVEQRVECIIQIQNEGLFYTFFLYSESTWPTDSHLGDISHPLPSTFRV